MSESRHAAELRRRLDDRHARIAVLGLGYVGLPLAMAFARQGFPVLGFDVDAGKVDDLNAGRSYIGHIDAEEIRTARSSGFEATAEPARLVEADALLLCVPTPLTEDRQPDLGYVERTTDMVARTLRPGQLVVLESTTYPGTTREVVAPKLAATGLTLGEQVFLAYSPERENPGASGQTLTRIPKVVGGLDAASLELASLLYGAVVPRVHPVSSPEVAEASKLTENVFRAVNIALVNELKIVYERLGIDIWEVLDAAETKPFGFMRFDPGPGWGGHCIPIDPFYLSWRAQKAGSRARFIELAGEVNLEMPAHVIDRLRLALEERGSALAGSRVLLLGLAYKANVADPRESPAFELLDRLLQAGATVTYHDPWIPEAPKMRTWAELPPLRSRPLTAENLGAEDAVVIVTDHEGVDWTFVLEHARLIVDTRGVYRRNPATHVVRA
jgi:UDP-N-acetyl-D-glucosamine dehydrogenase